MSHTEGRTDVRRTGHTASEAYELLCRWQNRRLWLDLMGATRHEARRQNREEYCKEKKRANANEPTCRGGR